MTVSDPISPERYRRRIVGLGAVTLVVAFAVGAAIFIPAVQRDLEERVEDEFDVAGFDGVSASFSGQDGTLTCAMPFDDPQAAEERGEDVYGVRAIDLDESCSPTGTPAPDTTDQPVIGTLATDPVETDPPDATSDTTTSDTATATAAPPATDPGLDGIVEIVDGDPLFSELAGALETAGLDGDDGLGGDGPFTLLAPTDAAFDAAFDQLGADAFNALTSDPDVLRTVLLHHATAGEITSTDFVAGELEMLDGTTITVDPDGTEGITFTSNGAVSEVDDPATQLDIEASNGVIHAIDRLLIPDGLELGDSATDVVTTASFAGGRMTFSGVVQTEDQRVALVAAPSGLDPANVVDELTIDPDASIEPADFGRLAVVAAAMPSTLVDGDVTLDGNELALTGTALDDEAQAAMSEVAAGQEAMTELSARRVADAVAAAALQSELNDFVGANPIMFEPNSATISNEADAMIEQLAYRVRRLNGTSITVVGHTDSDGVPATNQELSERRAASVVEALVEQGADPTSLASAGRGATEPILDASGSEDKAASRRVEFIVEVKR